MPCFGPSARVCIPILPKRNPPPSWEPDKMGESKGQCIGLGTVTDLISSVGPTGTCPRSRGWGRRRRPCGGPQLTPPCPPRRPATLTAHWSLPRALLGDQSQDSWAHSVFVSKIKPPPVVDCPAADHRDQASFKGRTPPRGVGWVGPAQTIA